jgi:hypothetical protein
MGIASAREFCGRVFFAVAEPAVGVPVVAADVSRWQSRRAGRERGPRTTDAFILGRGPCGGLADETVRAPNVLSAYGRLGALAGVPVPSRSNSSKLPSARLIRCTDPSAMQ